MSEQFGATPSPAARSFAEHIRTFHASLPEDEQRLLEKVFALAEAAVEGDADVQGYAADYFLEFNKILQSHKGQISLPSNLLNFLQNASLHGSGNP